MKTAEYRITISDDANAEAILNEIDEYFIELEHRYTTVQVQA
jgi:hypothetical protein